MLKELTRSSLSQRQALKPRSLVAKESVSIAYQLGQDDLPVCSSVCMGSVKFTGATNIRAYEINCTYISQNSKALCVFVIFF